MCSSVHRPLKIGSPAWAMPSGAMPGAAGVRTASSASAIRSKPIRSSAAASWASRSRRSDVRSIRARMPGDTRVGWDFHRSRKAARPSVRITISLRSLMAAKSGPSSASTMVAPAACSRCTAAAKARCMAGLARSQ